MTYTISGKTVGEVGFGLMSLTNPSKGLTDEQGVEAIRAAISCGANYLNGGQFYGPPTKNSLTLLNKYFEKYPEDVGKVVVNIKGGMGSDMAPAGDTKSINGSIDACLQALGPVGRIDQFEAARKDPNVPYEETLAAIQSYVDAGKIGGIACSELGADTLSKAAEKFKITALEIEVSLFRTEPLTNGLLATCAELDIPVLAYSPLGRGFLGGEIKSLDDIPENDFRRFTPRYFPENFDANLELVRKVEVLAQKKGCSTSQIAISWLVSLSKRPGMPKIIPIPGSTKAERIKQNSTVVNLSDEDLVEIDEILKQFTPKGDRYPGFHATFLDG